MGNKMQIVNKNVPPEHLKNNQYYPFENDNTQAALKLSLESLKRTGGRPAEYSNTVAGLEAFRQKSIDFFEYVSSINANSDLEKKVFVDVENWTSFLGISRMTLSNYVKRGGEWATTIDYFKNHIFSIKKQAAMHYAIPPMVFALDAINNHSYYNTNEYHITVEQPQNKKEEERAALEQEITKAGLVWNEESGEFLPALPAERGDLV